MSLAIGLLIGFWLGLLAGESWDYWRKRKREKELLRGKKLFDELKNKEGK